MISQVLDRAHRKHLVCRPESPVWKASPRFTPTSLHHRNECAFGVAGMQSAAYRHPGFWAGTVPPNDFSWSEGDRIYCDIN
jgi:hypothetical protein